MIATQNQLPVGLRPVQQLLQDATHLQRSKLKTFTGEWRSEQDNAPVHTAKVMKEYFMSQDAIINWPARSPDLSPIENLWGMIVREAFQGFRHFDYEDDLVEASNYA